MNSYAEYQWTGVRLRLWFAFRDQGYIECGSLEIEPQHTCQMYYGDPSKPCGRPEDLRPAPMPERMERTWAVIK